MKQSGKFVETESLKDRFVGQVGLNNEFRWRFNVVLFLPVDRDLGLGNFCGSILRHMLPPGTLDFISQRRSFSDGIRQVDLRTAGFLVFPLALIFVALLFVFALVWILRFTFFAADLLRALAIFASRRQPRRTGHLFENLKGLQVAMSILKIRGIFNALQRGSRQNPSEIRGSFAARNYEVVVPSTYDVEKVHRAVAKTLVNFAIDEFGPAWIGFAGFRPTLDYCLCRIGDPSADYAGRLGRSTAFKQRKGRLTGGVRRP